ncbi:U-box domain-containing protein kinase family protein [Rhynchospora pubera]|uniref:RING-type E3 ubiquitin transferase n=1 Tax=Rhynchospora pubera TaxID=906938 RepID=A0AAV8B2Y9_9POAL|nr:U-box domain-containing protein kinase family protein [Rhynchospora pubera]
MGAAADKHYSRKMKTPKSKKAIMVMDKADPLCKIWFVCKGALICTRYTLTGKFWDHIGISTVTCPQLIVRLYLKCIRPNWCIVASAKDNLNRPEAVGLIYPWEGIPKGDLSDPEHTLWTAHDELVNNPWPRNYRKEAMMHSSVPQESDDDSNFYHRAHTTLLDGLRMDADMYEKYEEVLNELEAAKKEAFQESNKRRRAEMDLLSAHQKRERDDALNKLEENMQALQEMPSTVHSNLITNEFSYDELVTATRGPDTQTSSPLIGTCSEAYALVYEYLPNGSLEDRLACSNNTLPLSWQARTRIIGEICSGLIFLHSSQPHPVVHGDLKLENILLTENLVSKISNFGICQRVIESNDRTTSVYRTTNTKSTLAYMNPELISTGEVTTQTDVYSFGIIILRLLTGWQPLNISNKVEEAIQNGNMHSVIDPSAGEWPFVQASQLAHLGLRCIALSRMKCADLVTDVWQDIKTMMQVAAMSACPLSFALASDDQHVPSYFICPIFQEIMTDPHIAADGFTYEAEAIRGWLNSGHDTSPMTNLKLANKELIPNRALRSVILEWFPNLSQ